MGLIIVTSAIILVSLLFMVFALTERSLPDPVKMDKKNNDQQGQ